MTKAASVGCLYCSSQSCDVRRQSEKKWRVLRSVHEKLGD